MSKSNPGSKAVTRLVTAEEREAAVGLLSAAFANDAIAVDEFEKRVSRVYAAEDAQALQAITRDLPAAKPEKASVPAVMNQSTAVARPPAQTVKCVLSSTERRIQGPMPERLDVRTVMSSLELDLRRADFPTGVTEIHVDAIMASVEIELPEHVQVEDAGHALLGSFSVRGRSRRGRSDDAPVVRVVGRAIFGSVEVEVDD